MKIFKKILIANRGEIAVRIIRSARKLGIKVATVYSRIDEDSLHVTMADEAYCIGEKELSETYLNIPLIIETALRAHCEAIHPGYGFLAENPAFVQACQEAGIVFIGPSAEVMRVMGNKIGAREFAVAAGVPTTKGLTGTRDEILRDAGQISFPVLVKAAAGGGGKGMRIVHQVGQLADALESTSREAASYFGDGTVYLEKYIEEPRHIEIQVIGDHFGNVVHLYERECSIQRRYQKIIEESPSPTLTPEIREQMGAAAVQLSSKIGYYSAGTIEFLVDKELSFYFLEMNTRIQVEHPVTEMVTGIDLVEEQILVAAGNPLSFKQEDIHQQGHAIECRIYAEDPARNFLPSPGEMLLYREPEGEGIRIDAGIDREVTIQSFFDPMISKLIVGGKDREVARERMIRALKHYIVHGIETNIPYLTALLQNEAYIQNIVSTHFCDDHTTDLLENIAASRNQIPLHIPVLAYFAYWHSLPLLEEEEGVAASVWNHIGYWRHLMELHLACDGKEYALTINSAQNSNYECLLDDVTHQVSLMELEEGSISVAIDDFYCTAHVSENGKGEAQVSYNGHIFKISRDDILIHEDVFSGSTHGTSGDPGNIVSPMPGKVIKINVGEGDSVVKGQVLLVVESMKMENSIISTIDGVVDKINVKQGDSIDSSTRLVHLNETKSS